MTDFHSAWRYVRRQPGFSLLAIISLGVAIGVNVAMLSVVNGFLLRDAVDVDADRYVGLYTTTQDARRAFRPFSWSEFLALKADRTVFADVSAVFYSQVAIGETQSIRRAFSLLVSENFFALASARPVAGRFFSAEECAPDSQATVAVASYPLWRANNFDPAFLGSRIRVNGRPYTIVGIAPEGFSGFSPLLAPEIWLPMGSFAAVAPAFAASRASGNLAGSENFQLQLFARLQGNLNRESAKPLLPVLARRLSVLHPELDGSVRELVLARPFGIAPQPARESAFAPVTALTLGLSTLVLIVACLNLSNLLLARASTRTVEIATRLALGASRTRIIRQLLTEGLLLGGAAAALGVILSWWIGTILTQVLASRVAEFGFQVVARFEPDGLVLSVTVLLSLVASLAFSLGPALRGSRLDLATDLKRSTIGEASPSMWSGRNLLLVVQASVSFVLLFASGLFVRSAIASAKSPAGLEVASRAVAEVDFSLQRESESGHQAISRALTQVRRTAGIESAGVTSLLPFANDVQISRTTRTAWQPGDPQPVIGAFAAVSDGYLPTMAHMVRGRDFTGSECMDISATRVCVVDEELARRLFPVGDPVGQSLHLRGGPDGQVNQDFTVIGIVSAHAQDVADRDKPMARIFIPLVHINHPRWYFAARGSQNGTRGDVATARALENALRATTPELPIVEVHTLEAFLGKNFSRWQAGLGAFLFSAFGGIAAILAAVGIYGVTAYALARRTREFGVRIALGAGRLDIVRLVVERSLHQLLISFAVGGCIACGTGFLLAGFVPGVRPFDPLAFFFAGAVLLGAASPALLYPSLRATKIDPMIALRAE